MGDAVMAEVLRRGEVINVEAPEPVTRPVRSKPVSGLVFLARLSDAEYAAILGASQQGLAGGQPQLVRWIDMLRLAGQINLQGDDALAAKAAVVAAGLLTQERADEVFAP